MQVHRTTPPPDRLISRFAAADGHHADAFYADLSGQFDLAELISAFYTTPLFRLERWVLRLFARRPSTDEEARALAEGSRDSFAVWQTEARKPHEILLADQQSGRTKSWLAVDHDSVQDTTRVWFGSVVVPVTNKAGKTELGPVFHSLMGVHVIYSRALLGVAARRMSRQAA